MDAISKGIVALNAQPQKKELRKEVVASQERLTFAVDKFLTIATTLHVRDELSQYFSALLASQTKETPPPPPAWAFRALFALNKPSAIVTEIQVKNLGSMSKWHDIAARCAKVLVAHGEGMFDVAEVQAVIADLGADVGMEPQVHKLSPVTQLRERIEARPFSN